jgi:hypothetical protein
LPLASSTGTPERHVAQRLATRFRIVDEIGLGEHDHRFGPRVEREHQFAFQTAWARGRSECVHEEHDVDVGGQRVRHGPHPVERCPSGERRAALQHVLDPFGVGGRDHPVTHRHVGADVAHPEWIGDAARFVHRADHGAPSPVEARDTARRSRATQFGPRIVEIRRPAECRVGLVDRARHRRGTVPAMWIRPFPGHTLTGNRHRAA